MRPDQMRTENSPALGFNERLVTVLGFAGVLVVYQSDTLAEFTRSFGACLTRLGFGKANGSDRRQREGDAGDATIVRAVTVAFQDIGGDDFAIVVRYWRQRRTRGRCVPASVDDRVGDALQILVEPKPAILHLRTVPADKLSSARSGTRPAACTTRSARKAAVPCVLRVDAEPSLGVFDPCDRVGGTHIDADVTKCLHQPFDQL